MKILKYLYVSLSVLLMVIAFIVAIELYGDWIGKRNTEFLSSDQFFMAAQQSIIRREAAGLPPDGGAANWEEFWERIRKNIVEQGENVEWRLDYIETARREHGLPEIELESH